MTSEFEICRRVQVMPRNMEWKCSSLEFLFEYKLSIFKIFSLKNDKAIWIFVEIKYVACKIENILPISLGVAWGLDQ